jgi:ABC-2 type transport system permease protein
MKLLVCKNFISDRVEILKASIVYNWQIDSAYPFANIGRMVGSVLYTITTLIYINVLYQKLHLIAGYSQQEMLVFFAIGQVALFTIASFSYDNIIDLIASVNTGGLDLILTKPLPSLFYVSIKNIGLFRILVENIGSLTIMFFFIKWSTLSITFYSFISALIVFVCGLISMHVIQFIAALPVFWIGESSSLLDSTWSFEYNIGRTIPYEGFSAPFQIIFTTLLPSLITTGVTASVLLSKSNPLLMAIYCLAVASFCLIIKNLFWRLALKNYTSASS